MTVGVAAAPGMTRGRMAGQVSSLTYPSPFFDVAQTYLPTSMKHLFRFCRYYFLTNGLLNATVFKLSEYPITDIIIECENDQQRGRWETYLHEHHRIRRFQVEMGLDYHTYGNCFVSMSFPFHKYLRCRGCGFEAQASRITKHWVFSSMEFRLTCPRCRTTANCIAEDRYVQDVHRFRFVRWNPEDIDIKYNETTGETDYYFTLPPQLRNDIIIGNKEVVATTSQVYIQALKLQKGIRFDKKNLFHMKRPSIAWQDHGWGIPLLMPVLKDTFYLQIMKKAQEAVLLEHIVPMRVLFPQAGSGTSDPYCVSPDTLVETPTGLQPASEIGEGDYLRSHTGAWRRVEAMKRRSIRNEEKVFKFKIASLAAFPFTVSEEHPVLAVPRVGGRKKPRAGLVDPEFIEAKNLKKGDYVAYPAKRVVRRGELLDLKELLDRGVTDQWVYRRLGQKAAEVYEWLERNGDPTFAWGEREELLQEKGWDEASYATAYQTRRESSVDRIPRFLEVSEDLAALIGYYLAEGYLSGSLASFALHLEETDLAEHIEKLVQRLGFRGVSHVERPGQNGRTVQLQDVLLSEILQALCGKGFAEKRVPACISEAPNEHVLAMLRTLFAGDGCDFKTDTDRVALKLSNPSVILEARRLLLSLGLIGGVIREEPTETSLHRSTTFHLNYNGRAAGQLRALFRGEDVTDVPQKNGLFRGDYVLLRIDEVEETAEVPEVIGFQMHGDRSFCVAGVATHNTSVNLVDWKEQVAAEVARWRHDQNYIPIMPLPIGQQAIGGDGRALLIFQELQQQTEHIMMGCGVPREFLQGGLSYSGSNVSLRMLENSFITYVGYMRDFLRWAIRTTANFMGWPEVSFRFKPFKMADDIQRKMYLFQLNQAKVGVSDTTLLSDVDLDAREEGTLIEKEQIRKMERMKKEQIAMAEMQGEAQVIMMKMQAKAQETLAMASSTPAAPGEPGEGMSVPQGAQSQLSMDSSSGMTTEQGFAKGANGSQQGIRPDLLQMAQAYARQLSSVGEQQQQMALQSLQQQSPELAQLVQQFLSQEAKKTENTSVDMRPLPEVRAPQREMQMM